VPADLNQISDATLPISRKAQREQDREKAKAFKEQREARDAASKEKLNAATKRKRSDVDEEDPKLKEFLEVMQPASKIKKWATDAVETDTNEPPSKIQAIEVPEADSDNEYETVPKKTRKSSPPKATTPIPVPASAVENAETPDPAEDEPMIDISAVNDDDWLRSRTNRLLDLVDLDDLPAQQPQQTSEVANVGVVSEPTREEATIDEQETFDEQNDFAEEEEDKPDPVLEAISSNGRLFIRNLPYTATEEDIRHHFEPYGALDEVCMFPLLIVSFPPL